MLLVAPNSAKPKSILVTSSVIYILDSWSTLKLLSSLDVIYASLRILTTRVALKDILLPKNSQRAGVLRVKNQTFICLWDGNPLITLHIWQVQFTLNSRHLESRLLDLHEWQREIQRQHKDTWDLLSNLWLGIYDVSSIQLTAKI